MFAGPWCWNKHELTTYYLHNGINILYSHSCLAHKLVKSKIFWVGLVWKTVFMVLSDMWRWAPRKQKQHCIGLLKNLQREKVQVGKASIQGFMLESSSTYWIHCPGKVHSCERISSSRCQDQAKLELLVAEVPEDLDGGLFQLAHSPFWKMFHWLLFGWAGPVYSSQVLVLSMIPAFLTFLKGYFIFSWTEWLHTKPVIKDI